MLPKKFLIKLLYGLIVILIFNTSGWVATVCKLDFGGKAGTINFLKCKNLPKGFYTLSVKTGHLERFYYATNPQKVDYLPFAVWRFAKDGAILKVYRNGKLLGRAVLKLKGFSQKTNLKGVLFPRGYTPRERVKVADFRSLSLEGQNRLIRKALRKFSPVRFYERRALFPLSGFKRISSPFGVSRIIFGQYEGFHKGVDLAAPEGTPVLATLSGRVVLVGKFTLTGNTVIIDHGWGLTSLYAHLSGVCVKEGEFVKRGEVIGYVGSTGRSTGAHLHFGVYLMDTAVDPIDFLKKRLRP